jgi:hypothetical protein
VENGEDALKCKRDIALVAMLPAAPPSSSCMLVRMFASIDGRVRTTCGARIKQ